MPMEYTAEDVLNVAVQVEREAAAFYRTVAEAQPDKAGRLLKIAGMEEGHARLFESMANELSDDEKSRDLLGIDRRMLQAAAKRRAGEGSGQQVSFSGEEPMGDILRKAIDMEKSAVAFYTDLKASVPSSSCGAALDDVIEEEMGHIAALNTMLKHEDGA